MKQEVSYNGLKFEPYLTKEQIAKRVAELAKDIERDCAGKCPLFVCVLNGAFTFAADLFRAVDIDAEISFIRLKSYDGTGSTGKVKELVGLTEDIEGRDVIIIEDIVDTGNTMVKLIEDFKAKKPANVKVATLLYKPDSVRHDLQLDYVGFPIPSKFIIGYGLDLDGIARNLPDIYVLKETK
ncbi:MAG: hypoxanthine phosphoribosyltransferase [Muribaculaceae bacterium]|nr:hypoxanthine phosphoribosyltransferase [Muribaculaceae bacterium]MBR1963836.1 hypoxanthine phosphoribosyltransferase [Muribaculaceae bacterium]